MPVWGCPQYYDSFFSSEIGKIFNIQDPHVELHLLRSCLSVFKVTHILCCVRTSSLGSFPSCFDFRLRECLSRIMCCNVSDGACHIAFQVGGLGLHESERSANPAFLGSCNFTRILVARLVDSSNASMSLRRESSAFSSFEDLPISVSRLLLRMIFKLI